MFISGMTIRHKNWGLMAKVLDVDGDKVRYELFYPLEVIGGYFSVGISTSNDWELPIFKCKHCKEKEL